MSIHVVNIMVTTSGRRRRNVATVVDALDNLVNEGLLDPAAITTVADLQAFLVAQAEAAGATTTQPIVDTVDFVIGFDEQNVTRTRVVKLRIRAYPGKLKKSKFFANLKIENKKGNFLKIEKMKNSKFA